MIEVSELANQKVDEFVKANNSDANIRIYLNEGG